MQDRLWIPILYRSSFFSISGFIFDCWRDAQQPSRVATRSVLGRSFPHGASSHRCLGDVPRRASVPLNSQHTRFQRRRGDHISTFCQIHLSYVGIWGKCTISLAHRISIFRQIKNLAVKIVSRIAAQPNQKNDRRERGGGGGGGRWSSSLDLYKR